MVLSPRASAKLIASTAKHIQIKQDGVQNVANLIERSVARQEFSLATWKSHEVNPKSAIHFDCSSVDWIFLIDTLNFSFWTETSSVGEPEASSEGGGTEGVGNKEPQKYEIKFNGKTYTGYWALCAAINRALQAGIPICKSEYYSKISETELRNILKSDSSVEMPLLEERLAVIRQTGAILNERFGGSFVKCVEEAKGSATKLLDIIVSNFPSYKDEADYEGQRVSFYKRAQILVGDIWGCFEGESLGKFEDIDVITMFADYRVPQVLVQLGALEYDQELTEDLRQGKELANGSRKEVEIRGCTIWAVEEICGELAKRNNKSKMNAILVDYYLWDLRRMKSEEFEKTPFHRTRCIYY